jgi:hypothetical protein
MYPTREMRNEYKISARKPKGERPLGGFRHGREENTSN